MCVSVCVCAWRGVSVCVCVCVCVSVCASACQCVPVCVYVSVFNVLVSYAVWRRFHLVAEDKVYAEHKPDRRTHRDRPNQTSYVLYRFLFLLHCVTEGMCASV